MKRVNLIKPIIVILIMCLALSGLFACTGLRPVMVDESGPKVNQAIDTIVSALKAKDHKPLKALFSDFALKNDPNIDSEIDYLFNSIKGDIKSSQQSHVGSEDGSNEYGVKKSSYMSFGSTIKTTENEYSIGLIDCTRDDTDKSKIGITKLVIIETSKDSDTITSEFLYNDGIAAGIYNPDEYPIGMFDHKDETFEKIKTAVNSRDINAFKQLFSKNVINKTKNLDENINAAINYINGNIVNPTKSAPAIGGNWENGMHIATIYYYEQVFTDSKKYPQFQLAYYDIYNDKEEPEQTGLYWLYISRYTEDNGGEHAKILKPDDIQPGIYAEDNVRLYLNEIKDFCYK
jgi:hypothetical protein